MQTSSGFLAVLLAITRVQGKFDEDSLGSANIISKDIAILGGGASGAHAAVRLREDFGKSIVLVEKQGHLVCQYQLWYALISLTL